MITGAHVIIYSTDPENDRIFLRDIMKFPNVDAGDGWLIFGLPPAEVAGHPSAMNNGHEFFLMCDDIEELIEQMKRLKVKCSRVQNQRWGLLAKLRLPGRGDLKVYQLHHVRPRSMKIKAA